MSFVMGLDDAVEVFRRVESHVIAVNAAIVAFLAMVNFGLFRVHSERSRWERILFAAVASGWLLNLVYLVFESLKSHVFGGPTGAMRADWHPEVILPLNLTNTASSAAILIGGLAVLWQPRHLTSLFAAVIFTAIAAAVLVSLPPPNDKVFLYLSVPGAVFDALAWIALAMALSRVLYVEWKTKATRLLVSVPLWIYAVLQFAFLPLAPTCFGQEHVALVSLCAFGVSLLCKIVHLLGLAQFFAYRSHRLQADADEVLTQKRYISQMVHELKTPAAELQLELDSLERGGSKIDAKKVVAEITDLATRLLAIVQGSYEEVRHFGPEGKPGTVLQWRMADMNSLLEASILSLKALHKEKEVSFRRQYSRHLKSRCQPQNVKRVFDNLLLNAYEALGPNGGIICIISGRDKHDNIVIQIKDNGVGFPPHSQQKLGKQRFSTKEGQDRGHGLLTVHDHLNAHRGTFSVQSPPPDQPQGTLVTVTLPVRN